MSFFGPSIITKYIFASILKNTQQSLIIRVSSSYNELLQMAETSSVLCNKTYFLWFAGNRDK
jgi:hypothetical protein